MGLFYVWTLIMYFSKGQSLTIKLVKCLVFFKMTKFNYKIEIYISLPHFVLPRVFYFWVFGTLGKTKNVFR